MKWTPQPTETRAATVHHTAGTNDYGCADSAAIVRGIFEYHAVHLGWGDIGYHALVDKCGTIFEGRAQGLERDVIGGHAMGFNPNTFGVAMLGNFQDVVPTSDALTAAGAIIGWKLRESGSRRTPRWSWCRPAARGRCTRRARPSGCLRSSPTAMSDRRSAQASWPTTGSTRSAPPP
ncbi:N-acetylmuramoyl-L-alanine amidase [Saccharopolyspora spinosporotrichia]